MLVRPESSGSVSPPNCVTHSVYPPSPSLSRLTPDVPGQSHSSSWLHLTQKIPFKSVPASQFARPAATVMVAGNCQCTPSIRGHVQELGLHEPIIREPEARGCQRDPLPVHAGPGPSRTRTRSPKPVRKACSGSAPAAARQHGHGPGFVESGQRRRLEDRGGESAAMRST